jgi:AraC-like DNA-binding protein
MHRGPIVQASHLRVILDAYRASGVDPGPDADRLGISIESAEDPEAFVYEWPVWHFFEAGRARIRPDFGFFAYDQAHVAAFGQFGRRIVAPTLIDVLSRFLDGARATSTVADFRLEVDGLGVRFIRRGPRLGAPDWPVEQYVISLMIGVCRIALGSAWIPRRVWLQYAGPLEKAEAGWLRGIDVGFGAPVTTLELPRRLLHRPAKGRGVSSDAGATSVAVAQAVASMLDAGPPAPDAVGARLGLSERTLQRRLSEEGTSLRTIVGQQRYGRARAFLCDPSLSIADVSARLGYQDPPAFTRAFRKWAGLTPSEFRGAMRAAGVTAAGIAAARAVPRRSG